MKRKKEPVQHGKAKIKVKDFKGTMKKVFSYIGAYKVPMILVGICSVMGTVFTTVGPKVLSKATTALFEGLGRKMAGTGGIDFSKIAAVLAALMGLYLVGLCFSAVQGFLMTKISQNLCYRLRGEISEKINRLPLKYFESRTIGEVLSRITNDVDTLGQSINQSIIDMITAAATLVGVMVMMLSISPLMTLIAITVLPVSGLLISVVVRFSQRYYVAQQANLGRINGQVEEVCSGQNIIRVFNREEKVHQEFSENNKSLYQSSWKSQFFGGMMYPVMGLVGNLGYIAVAVSGSLLAIRQIITVGDIQAFIQYVKNFSQPIAQVAQITNQLQSAAAAAERVFEFLGEEEEPETAVPVTQKDSGVQAVEGNMAETGILEAAEGNLAETGTAETKGSVEFSHVHFGYDPEKIIIRDFNCRVEPGQKVAIVGPTGAGKTTMVKLLMRFYDVLDGCIRVDGRDIRDLDRHELRQEFGMVLQDTWLFQGTIMENIRYGRLDATDEEVIQAARAAHADHFIRSLPGGYQMELDENASNVSQGQRQLITIARAILSRRSIMILDEATSSVDTRTEVQIQKAMDHLMQGKTSFIIAHRLSTIRNADVILVMKDGDIVEQGSHESLLEHRGFYYELYQAQFAA